MNQAHCLCLNNGIWWPAGAGRRHGPFSDRPCHPPLPPCHVDGQPQPAAELCSQCAAPLLQCPWEPHPVAAQPQGEAADHGAAEPGWEATEVPAVCGAAVAPPSWEWDFRVGAGCICQRFWRWAGRMYRRLVLWHDWQELHHHIGGTVGAHFLSTKKFINPFQCHLMSAPLPAVGSGVWHALSDSNGSNPIHGRCASGSRGVWEPLRQVTALLSSHSLTAFFCWRVEAQRVLTKWSHPYLNPLPSPLFRYGRRYLLIVSYLLMAVSGTGAGLSTSLPMFCLFRFGCGLALSGIALNSFSLSEILTLVVKMKRVFATDGV